MAEVNLVPPVALTPPSAAARGKRSPRNTTFWMPPMMVALGVGLLTFVDFDAVTARLQRPAQAGAGRQVPIFRVGDCVKLAASNTDQPDIAKASCGAEPSYTVGSIVQAGAACADTSYVRYLWTVDNKAVGTLCLADNLIVDHCYRWGPTGRILDVVECAAATDMSEKVDKRLDNVSDVTQCPPNTTAYAYPTPARTYCMTSPQAATAP